MPGQTESDLRGQPDEKANDRNQTGQLEFSVLEKPTSPIQSKNTSANQFKVTPQLNNLISSLVLEHLPHEYVQDKKWGKQSRRWSGIRFRRDGARGKLETESRYKQVNHGTWQKYSARLLDPEDQFSIQLTDVARNQKGEMIFKVGFTADLDLDARQSKWVKGVQLYSLSAEGTAKVSLLLNCRLATQVDFSHLPPDLVFDPYIEDAQIIVDEFKIDRVSKAGGEVSQQVSRLARKELESQIEKKEQRLVKKINEKIAAKKDRFRLSISEAVNLKWFEKTKDQLPDTVREAARKLSQTSDDNESNVKN
ncbi:MAG: hypothetical protein AAGA30_09685 [Planctomycetota bacterium]